MIAEVIGILTTIKLLLIVNVSLVAFIALRFLLKGED